MPLFSGQGKVYVAEALAGVPGGFRYVGDVSELQTQMQVTTLEHKEHSTGQRLTDLRLITEKKSNFSFTLQEFSKENLALALFGTPAAVVGGTVVAEALPVGLVDLDYARVANPDISVVSITDSAATPATLVAGTDYAITSAPHGTIQILNVGAYVQPFVVAYTYGTYDNVPMFTQSPVEHWVKFDGLNTANTNRPVVVELYRVVFDPLDTMDLITDTILDLKLAGNALYDATKVADAMLGTFGRIMLA